MSKLSRFITQSSRVLRITRKPSKEEYKAIVKISGLGMAVMGGMGFLLHMIKQLL